MSEEPEKLAEKIHNIYNPDDKNCSWTAKDLHVAKLLSTRPSPWITINSDKDLPKEGFGWFWVVWQNGERQEYSVGWYNEQAIYKWWHQTGGHHSLPIHNVTHYQYTELPKKK